MTKAQLLKKLEAFPDDMEVLLTQTNDEYATSEIETVEIRDILFQLPNISKIEWPKEKCIVISDEY